MIGPDGLARHATQLRSMSRALVLGSGGLTGIAWEAGVLAALADAGFDVTSWDLVVGSSAGAFVGARMLADGSAEPLARAQEAVVVAQLEADFGVFAGPWPLRFIRASRRRRLGWLQGAAIVPLAIRAALANARRDGLAELGVVPAVIRSRRAGSDPAAGLRALGRLARANATHEDGWVRFWEDRLTPGAAWSEGRLVITAIDVLSGERMAIEGSSGASLARAVAASTALAGLLPPIAIAGRPCIDGGSGSPTNADLAAGHSQVLVVAPMDRGVLARETDGLRAAGARVDHIQPSEASTVMLGRELGRLDPARIAASVRAGRADGTAAAHRLA